MENQLLDLCNTPQKGLCYIDGLQIEHILPQTPRDGAIPSALAASRADYEGHVYRLGNVTLLESVINQAVNKHNRNKQWLTKAADITFLYETGTYTVSGNQLTIIPANRKGGFWAKTKSTKEWGKLKNTLTINWRKPLILF